MAIRWMFADSRPMNLLEKEFPIAIMINARPADSRILCHLARAPGLAEVPNVKTK